eukprot:GDKJ01020435.1.p1 GENE.GDKJ01020435.1~~GDKJ01020435.1.p1  ORF type:complete len:865 (-),score=231.42 GDKJ01020435.1:223-2817(-)
MAESTKVRHRNAFAGMTNPEEVKQQTSGLRGASKVIGEIEYNIDDWIHEEKFLKEHRGILPAKPMSRVHATVPENEISHKRQALSSTEIALKQYKNWKEASIRESKLKSKENNWVGVSTDQSDADGRKTIILERPSDSASPSHVKAMGSGRDESEEEEDTQPTRFFHQDECRSPPAQEEKKLNAHIDPAWARYMSTMAFNDESASPPMEDSDDPNEELNREAMGIVDTSSVTSSVVSPSEEKKRRTSIDAMTFDSWRTSQISPSQVTEPKSIDWVTIQKRVRTAAVTATGTAVLLKEEADQERGEHPVASPLDSNVTPIQKVSDAEALHECSVSQKSVDAVSIPPPFQSTDSLPSSFGPPPPLPPLSKRLALHRMEGFAEYQRALKEDSIQRGSEGGGPIHLKVSLPSFLRAPSDWETRLKKMQQEEEEEKKKKEMLLSGASYLTDVANTFDPSTRGRDMSVTKRDGIPFSPKRVAPPPHHLQILREAFSPARSSKTSSLDLNSCESPISPATTKIVSPVSREKLIKALKTTSPNALQQVRKRSPSPDYSSPETACQCRPTDLSLFASSTRIERDVRANKKIRDASPQSVSSHERNSSCCSRNRLASCTLPPAPNRNQTNRVCSECGNEAAFPTELKGSQNLVLGALPGTKPEFANSSNISYSDTDLWRLCSVGVDKSGVVTHIRKRTCCCEAPAWIDTHENLESDLVNLIIQKEHTNPRGSIPVAPLFSTIDSPVNSPKRCPSAALKDVPSEQLRYTEALHRANRAHPSLFNEQGEEGWVWIGVLKEKVRRQTLEERIAAATVAAKRVLKLKDDGTEGGTILPSKVKTAHSEMQKGLSSQGKIFDEQQRLKKSNLTDRKLFSF